MSQKVPLRRAKQGPSKPEWELSFRLHHANIPAPQTEYRFHPVRRWRFDLAWPDMIPPLAVEIQGGGQRRGRHHRPEGYRNDCEKMAFALMAGWRVLWVVPEQIQSGEAVEWISSLLGLHVATEEILATEKIEQSSSVQGGN